MYYAYANLAREKDAKTISTLYVGPDLDIAKAKANEAVAGGAESAVVKQLGAGTVYHVH